jgi:hypothetical protein
MSQYYLINVANIKNYLPELDKLDAERTFCWLDLLMENVQNNLLAIIQNDKNNDWNGSSKKITMLWEELPTKNKKIIFDVEKNNESIYNTLILLLSILNK